MKKQLALGISILWFLGLVQPAWPQNDDFLPRPILLGASGSNIHDISRLYCCSGTLGSLVQDADGQYILSNNHVLARTNQGIIGEEIIQPGLVDQEPVCSTDSSDRVAHLSKFVPISFKRRTTNRVDAAIAKTINGKVDPSGEILDIGKVSRSIVSPALYLPVQKSGRTTGLTSGTITAINVTVDVKYNKQCGMGSQIARFSGQMMIGPKGFSASGDSGSLIVEDCDPYPRAVGLLFAGSKTVTVANPISDVLSGLSVSMVGETQYCTSGPASGGMTESAPMTAQSSGLPLRANPRALEAATKVKERHEEAILDIEGVVGLGIGLSETVPRQAVIEVYVKKPKHEMKRLIPRALEGIPVNIVETGEILAY